MKFTSYKSYGENFYTFNKICRSMIEIPPHLIGPLATVSLGFFSLIIRWIGNLQLSGAGADLALSGTALQLSLVFRRLETNSQEPEGFYLLGLDIFFFFILLICWAISLKLVQKSLESALRWKHLNLYTFGAFLIGTFTLGLEIFWRL